MLCPTASPSTRNRGVFDVERVAFDSRGVHPDRHRCRRRKHVPRPDVELRAVARTGDGRAGQLAHFAKRALLVGARIIERVVVAADIGDGDSSTAPVRRHDGARRYLARLEGGHKFCRHSRTPGSMNGFVGYPDLKGNRCATHPTQTGLSVSRRGLSS